MRTPTISKTSYVTGLQCPKWLWYRLRSPKELPEVDEATQRRFDDGHTVGDLAKRVFPGGVEIPWDAGMKAAVRETQEALKVRRPIFEATFAYPSAFGPTLVRADVLNPVEEDQWDLIEVKGSTSIKDVYLSDVGFQRYAVEGSGLKLRDCYLMHLDRDYRRRGEVDPASLFEIEPVTSLSLPHFGKVEAELRGLFGMLAKGEPPEACIGARCSTPYDCPLMGKCWEPLPERDIFGLNRLGAKAWEFFEQGVLSRGDLPDDFHLSEKQLIQLAAERSGETHLQADELHSFLDGLTYPLYFLDFETFRTPVPLFDGIGPYGQVPFQYSLHVQREPGGDLEHASFLADLERGQADPRSGFLSRLREDLGQTGSIVAYNAAFETRILRETVVEFPDFGAWLEDDILPRVVDLYGPFRSFHVYHPDQGGSCSIKEVLPALTGRSYDELEIGDGDTAGAEFLRISFDDVAQEERDRVRQHLERYCGLDTEGMSQVLEALRTLLCPATAGGEETAR